MLNQEEEKKFRAAFNVRRVEKCCGTCRHFERSYEESGCANRMQEKFDSYEHECMKIDPLRIKEEYGAYGGIIVDEGFICDLWEQKKESEAAKC